MQIRRAQAGESALLSRIAFESKSHWPYTAAQLALWRKDLSITEDSIARHPVWVAQGEGAVADGFFVLLPAPQHWVLEHFWVRPAAMGQGVGKALLAHAARLAQQGGATALCIDSDPHAEAFYLACGAQRVGAVPAPVPGEPGRVRPQMLLAWPA